MTSRALTALVFFVAVLLGIVIVVGLAQKTLDPTGVAVALSTLITGIAGGLVLRGKSGGGPQS